MTDSHEEERSQDFGKKSIHCIRVLSVGLFFIITPLWIELAFNIVMIFVVEGSGWPYWPPILPNIRTVMSHTGIIGGILRVLYVVRYIFVFLGLLVLVAWMFSYRSEKQQTS